MSLPGLIRDRNSGLRKRRLEVYGRNRFLQEYRSYHADCLRIDADALPAALAFNPTSQQDILLVADDKGIKSKLMAFWNQRRLTLETKSIIILLRYCGHYQYRCTESGSTRTRSSPPPMASPSIRYLRRKMDMWRHRNSHFFSRPLNQLLERPAAGFLLSITAWLRFSQVPCSLAYWSSR